MNLLSLKRSTQGLAMLLLLTGLQACVVLPWYEQADDSRRNARERDLLFIKIGKTTRRDILLRIGEPDGIKEDGAVVFYRSTHDVMIVASEGGESPLVQKHRLLFIRFDENGVVRKKKVTRDLNFSL